MAFINRGCCIIMLYSALASGFAQAQDRETMVIQNVLLIDRTGKSEDQVVNVLIKDKRLKLLSVDEISLDDATIGYDASSGILLGNLNIGEYANFIILSKDPRIDINVLLETQETVLFAIRDGIIIKNEFTPISKPKIPKESKKTRWLSYTPPPMALPLSYEDKTKWNRWETKPFSGIFLAAAAVDRQKWLTQNSSSEQQVGDLFTFDGGEVRAFRFGIAGTINFKKPWIYTLLGATHAFDKGYNSQSSDKFTFLDYRLDIPLWQEISLSLGKQKEPISMERLQLGTHMQMQERSAIGDALNAVRNVGITINGTAFNKRTSWVIGVFNNWFESNDKFNESSTQVIGRVTGLLWISEDESNLFHLGFGYRFDNGKDLIRYQASPEFNQSPVFVDTDTIYASASNTINIEFTWREGPFWISAEFLNNGNISNTMNDPRFTGFNISGSWVLTKEMRKYNRRNGTIGGVPVARAINQGGPGAWEITTRYSNIDLNDTNVSGGEMDIISFGLNWWPTTTFGLNLNYRSIILERFEITGRSSGLMARVVLVLE